MEQNLVKVKDLYQPPKYECIEVSIEGVLCMSGMQSSDGVFETEDDQFVGEWRLYR